LLALGEAVLRSLFALHLRLLYRRELLRDCVLLLLQLRQGLGSAALSLSHGRLPRNLRLPKRSQPLLLRFLHSRVSFVFGFLEGGVAVGVRFGKRGVRFHELLPRLLGRHLLSVPKRLGSLRLSLLFPFVRVCPCIHNRL